MAPLGLRSIIIRSPMRQFSQKKKLTLIFFCVCFVCHRFGKNRRERKLRSSVIFRTRHKKNLRQPPKEKEEKVGSDPQKMEGALRFLYSGAKGNQKLLLRWTGHTQKKKVQKLHAATQKPGEREEDCQERRLPSNGSPEGPGTKGKVRPEGAGCGSGEFRWQQNGSSSPRLFLVQLVRL